MWKLVSVIVVLSTGILFSNEKRMKGFKTMGYEQAS